MTTMRAKLQISRVEKVPAAEILHFQGVPAKAYPADGSDEDNTFAKYSPSVELRMTVANPALLDAFKPGQVFYLDFTPVAP